MRRQGLIITALLASVVSFAVISARGGFGMTGPFSATEPGFDELTEEVEAGPPEPVDPYKDWKRPEGPVRVSLQAGHWKAKEVPDELENLKWNGARAAGVLEWEVNLSIAKEAEKMLEAEGIETEILPTTVPPEHWADVFVAIHADGSPNTDASGYKVAAPRRDRTGKAEVLAARLGEAYAETTGMQEDPNVTRNMRGYYAFNWRRYEHSLHPMTVSAIIETGFLTSAKDRKIIVREPKRAARAIADGVLKYLREEGLLTKGLDEAATVDAGTESE